jgi:hypothetical protein
LENSQLNNQAAKADLLRHDLVFPFGTVTFLCIGSQSNLLDLSAGDCTGWCSAVIRRRATEFIPEAKSELQLPSTPITKF